MNKHELMDNILDPFKKYIALLFLMTIMGAFIYVLNSTLEFIDNHFKDNPTYRKATTNFNAVSNTMIRTMGCAILPAVCMGMEETIKIVNETNKIGSGHLLKEKEIKH
jgi:uncharacterized membrane protein